MLHQNTMAQWLGRQLSNQNNPAAYFDPLLERLNPMWVRGYTPVRVEDVFEETADTKTFVLRPSRRWQGFVAGQHANLTVEVDGVRHQRPFSLSSSPEQWETEGTVTMTIKRQPQGLVTGWLHDQVRAGDWLEIGSAYGTCEPPQRPQQLLMIAGGSGITPFLSQLQWLYTRGYTAPITLIYLTRTPEDQIGAKVLHRLESSWPWLTVHWVTTEPDGDVPVLLSEQLARVDDLKRRETYLCGPPGLMDLADSLLGEAGHPEARRHRTSFTVATAPLTDEDLGGTVTFSRSDVATEAEDDASLLEVAESAQLRPEHGCRMGICHQCSCRKLEGTVVNRLTGKTSGPGEETIQLCVSVAKGPVTLDI
ncbi:ferredoxin reductase [Marinobacteraceae bacterium S3BR75-40.1]